MTKNIFELLYQDSDARAGKLTLGHGEVETPIFMPVGTRASVKTLDGRDLEELNAQIILGNTYHLYLRPGVDIMRKAGGLHGFMKWDKPILTDSGGFQVFSLGDLRSLHEQGAEFKSHLDGSAHLFTPESVVATQRALGSDIMMVLDECPPGDAEYNYVEKSLGLTLRWAKRCLRSWHETDPLYGYSQNLFPIIQGGVFPDLRKRSVEELLESDWPGMAIGGLSVGENKKDMRAMTKLSCELMPQDKPRYLMGVGTPVDIIESINLGVDMFDCVLPTRNARKATLFTSHGRYSAKAARYKEDFNIPIDENCDCYTCRTYDRAYIRHLYNVEEFTAMHLGTIHNLHYFLQLTAGARKAIINGTWQQYRSSVLAAYELSA
jgi:queuine tRNA-ribosyltransferase